MRGEPVYAQPKKSQLHEKEMTRGERDKAAKLMCVALYEAYHEETRGCIDFYPWVYPITDLPSAGYYNLMSLDWEHVYKRSTHPELIYDITNWQLLDRKRNNEKKDGEDFRTDKFKAWLKARKF